MNISSLVSFFLFGFSLPNISMRLWYFVDVETKTHSDWKIYWMSRLKHIKTEKFLGCWDRDSSRLRNLIDVETRTSRDSRWSLLLEQLYELKIHKLTHGDLVWCGALYGPIWSSMVKYGPIWSLIIPYGQVWYSMVKNGQFWQELQKDNFFSIFFSTEKGPNNALVNMRHES